MSIEVVRKDSKERILGNKSYVGDQEIIGIFQIKNSNNVLIFEFDPTTGTIKAYNTSGDLIWSVNTTSGEIALGTKGYLISDDGTDFRVLMGYQLNGFGSGKNYGFKVSREGYDVRTATDAQLIMSSKFTMPRENNISFAYWNYTNVLTYEDLLDCACQIDFDDWPDSSCYLEVTGKVGGGTGYYRMWNQTDGVAIAGSEATTTSTTATVFRGGAWTKPSGSKLLNLQYKVSDSAFYTDVYTARVVMRYSG